MSDRHDIVLREAERDNPDGLLQRIKALVEDVIPSGGDSGMRWMRGKSEQEIAKAIEIKARVVETIGKLEMERQRLIQERDAAQSANDLEVRKVEMQHAQRQYELETDRMTKVVESLERLHAMGVHIDAEVVLARVFPRSTMRINPIRRSK